MSRMVALERIAQVSLGYKSLQNEFCYVNQATIETYKIEKEYLKAIVVFRDIDARTYRQKPKTTTCLFECRAREADLRGTGVLRYIHAMALHSAKEKKQSGKAMPVQEALQAQGGGFGTRPRQCRILPDYGSGKPATPYTHRSFLLRLPW